MREAAIAVACDPASITLRYVAYSIARVLCIQGSGTESSLLKALVNAFDKLHMVRGNSGPPTTRL